MSEPSDFARRRAEKLRDSTKWTPEQALQACLDDIRTGKMSCTSLSINLFEQLPDGNVRPMSYLAGMTYESYVALLTVAQHNALDEWMN